MNILNFISPEDMRKQRYEICIKCEHAKGVLVLRCAACGCIIKSKVAVAVTECPKGKW